MPDDFHFEGGGKFDVALERWLAETVLATAEGAKTAAQSVITAARSNINSQSGRLAGSIGSDVTASVGGYEARIGPQGVEYARKVELGKRNPHGGMSHPYLKPGFERAVTGIESAFITAWRLAQPKG